MYGGRPNTTPSYLSVFNLRPVRFRLPSHPLAIGTQAPYEYNTRQQYIVVQNQIDLTGLAAVASSRTAMYVPPKMVCECSQLFEGPLKSSREATRTAVAIFSPLARYVHEHMPE